MKLILVFALVFGLADADVQNITVKGTVVCNNRRLFNITVSLMEKDRIDFEDELAHVQTNRQGRFSVFGQDDEYFSIDPFIRITHGCNTPVNCTRTSEYPIPRSLVNSVYNMKNVVLDVFTSNAEPTCA